MTGMAASGAGAGRRNRWAISFADLLLLLLGFFVLLHASGSRRDSMLSQVSRQFGGRPMARTVTVRAADLFAPGEALLTVSGRNRIAALSATLAPAQGRVEIRSEGTDRAQRRFDDWDLAAARLGAVARAFRASGIARDRLLIRGLDQSDGGSGQGQVIHIAPAR